MPRTAARLPRLLALRWHLLGLAAISLFPLVAFGGFLVRRAAEDERTRREHEFVQRAQVLAGALDREIASSMRALETLARSEHLVQGDLAGFRREALRVDDAQPSWTYVTLYTPDGRRVLDTRDTTTGPTDAVSFDEVLRTRHTTIGDVVRARDGQGWSFALRVPITAGKRVRYILSATVSAEEIARAISVGGPDADEWARSVVDRAGMIVARTRAPEQWVGRQAPAPFLARVAKEAQGHFRARVDGITAALAFAQAPLTGWTAVVVVPAARVDGPANQATALLAALGFLSVVVSAVAGFLLQQRFGQAVASAVRGAQALASGAPVAVRPNGILEVAHLGDALASSAQLLEARRADADRHLNEAAEARHQAEASSRAKDEFLAMLGHELRNPLSPILTALHLLRQRGTGWGREHEIISRQVGHVVRLVDDLLDVSRVTRSKVQLHPERLDLCGVVARSVEMASPLFEERQHRLDVDVPHGLLVFADPVRLAQVVGNLLTNAARYTRPGGHVTVVGRREAAGVALEVTDDGQGIAPELLPRIFELFVQGARGPDRAEGGLGIGLALVKSLVSLHGGTVEARSEGPGRGSTFRVVLPAAVPVADVAPVLTLPAPRSRPGPRLRVLVVDDNADAAALLGDFLGRAGHEVEVAHDGPSALALAVERPPDVAILDVGLPVMDGYEVAAQLRARLGPAAPAIVGVTGYGQERDRERSRIAGFLHHFVKPADPAEVLATIEELGGRAQQQRAPG